MKILFEGVLAQSVAAEQQTVHIGGNFLAHVLVHVDLPFVLDMSLLYEHYVYGLLYEAYNGKVTYQFSGATGYPDFLYSSNGFNAILDTKYIPKYENQPLDTYVIRQLSGYGRDLAILKRLGYPTC